MYVGLFWHEKDSSPFWSFCKVSFSHHTCLIVRTTHLPFIIYSYQISFLLFTRGHKIRCSLLEVKDLKNILKWHGNMSTMCTHMLFMHLEIPLLCCLIDLLYTLQSVSKCFIYIIFVLTPALNIAQNRNVIWPYSHTYMYPNVHSLTNPPTLLLHPCPIQCITSTTMQPYITVPIGNG